MVAAGAAGGIAAAFNAPIAAVFFALEIILGELHHVSLSVVVLASVISAVFSQAVSGSEPAFHVPAYSFGSVWELPFYLLLGLLAGVIAATYSKTLYKTRDLFQQLKAPVWTKTVFAGLVVGTVGLLFPQILGVGYETISAIFVDPSLSIGLLLSLLLAKLLMTAVSIGGGFQGGLFAPSLFLGAALGGLFGTYWQAQVPPLNIIPGAFAVVGMAAVLAGAVHAPLTAILLLFEMTNDYRIILPLMFAVMISLLVSQRLQSESVYTLPMLRHGIRLERGRDIEVLERLTVGEAMSPCEHVLKTSDLLTQAVESFTNRHYHGFPVENDNGELTRILTIHDLETAQADGLDFANHTVGEICTPQPTVAYRHAPLSVALRRMSRHEVGRLPVVEKENPISWSACYAVPISSGRTIQL